MGLHVSLTSRDARVEHMLEKTFIIDVSLFDALMMDASLVGASAPVCLPEPLYRLSRTAR